MGKRLEQELHKGGYTMAKNVHKKIPRGTSPLLFLGVNLSQFCTTVCVCRTRSPNYKLESRINI